MRALLTGATGFVGGHVLQALERHGYTVRCLVRPHRLPRRLESHDAEVVEGDLTDRKAVRGAVEGCRQVFHVAADYRLFARRPAELYAANVDGTRNVLEAAAAAGVERVVCTGSAGALGPPLSNAAENGADGSSADETSDVSLADMVGHYKRSKFEARQVAKEWAAKGLPVVLVHPTTPVGEGDWKPTQTGKLVLDYLRHRMPAYVDTGLNLVDVRDVAEGHWLAAERGRAGEEYILGHRNMTLREIFAALEELTGIRAPRRKLPHWLPLAVAAVDTGLARVLPREPRLPLEAVQLSRHAMYFDASKAVRQLGLPQSPVEEALDRAVWWFRNQGYLGNGGR